MIIKGPISQSLINRNAQGISGKVIVASLYLIIPLIQTSITPTTNDEVELILATFKLVKVSIHGLSRL